MANDNMHLQIIQPHFINILLVLSSTLMALLHPALNHRRRIHDTQHGLGATEAVVLADIVVGKEVQVDALHGPVDGGEPGGVGVLGGQELVELGDGGLDALEDDALGRGEAHVGAGGAGEVAD